MCDKWAIAPPIDLGVNGGVEGSLSSAHALKQFMRRHALKVERSPKRASAPRERSWWEQERNGSGKRKKDPRALEQLETKRPKKRHPSSQRKIFISSFQAI